MSRASQRNGMYECGEESPTPETSELSGTTSGVTRANEQGRATGLWIQGSGMPTRAKKLSWENGQEIKVIFSITLCQLKNNTYFVSLYVGNSSFDTN